jgi:hypothetical protein
VADVLAKTFFITGVSSGVSSGFGRHLHPGSDAVRLVREKLDGLRVELAAWEKPPLSTDFT